MNKWFLSVLCGLSLFCGCETAPSNPANATGTANTGKIPVFKLGVSEYPSWSLFFVAAERGLLDKAEGQQGELEKKYGVDIVLQEADYDTCIQMIGAGQSDATCITNMDALVPSASKPLVAVFPTSTSVGADALIVVNINDLDALKGKEVRGLEKSVSQYVFERNLELAGKNPDDYKFVNMDPAAAAQAMQTSQKNIDAIMVWNPFVLQTLRTREGAKVLFDSEKIPEEVIDCVMFTKESLARDGGPQAVQCLLDAFYKVNQMLDSSDKDLSSKTHVQVGAKFSSLGEDDMRLCFKQTKRYENAERAKELFNSKKFQEQTTPSVTKFCVKRGIVSKEPSVGFNKEDADLNFTTKYLDKASN